MENILGTFLKEKLDLFKTEPSVVGIDIGSSFLKIVQLKKKKGRAILETYGELALGPYADLSIGQATSLSAPKIGVALKDLFRESNVTAQESALSIPLGSSLLSLMEMPAIDNKQLAKMIPIEARKYIPVPISEVTLDWWIVPKHGVDAQEEGSAADQARKKRIDVLVVAIHNETVEKYRSIIQEAGLKNSFLELEVFSTARATFGNNTAPVMIFDLGAGTTKLAIVEYGIIRNQHIINRGSQDITIAISKALGVSVEKAEKLKREIGLSGTGDDDKVSQAASLTLEHIFSETNRVLLNYQRKYNKTIKSIVLTGGGVLLKGMRERAGKSLETEVLFADPFSKVDAPAFLEPILKDAGPEFAVAIGLALRKLQELG